MWFGIIIGFCTGVLFACWRYHETTGPLVRQAERVAMVFTRLDGVPVGPELQKLAKLAYLRRAI